MGEYLRQCRLKRMGIYKHESELDDATAKIFVAISEAFDAIDKARADKKTRKGRT